jgi:tetratricopeptide (TPR) repeat protein
MAYSALQLANAFLQTGELADARQVLDDYLAGDVVSDPDYEMITRLWLDLLAHGDEADQHRATSEYDRLLHFTPTDYIKRAMIHYRLGEINRARDILQMALAMYYPDDERLCESLLFIYKKMGDANAGLSLIKTLPKKWIWSRWGGDFALIARDFDLAIAYYTEAIGLLETRYAITGDSPAKIVSSPTMSDAEGLTIMGVYAELLLARAEAYHEAGRMDESKGDEARVKRLIPNDPTLR